MSSEETFSSTQTKSKGIYKALPNFIPELHNESKIID